MAVLDTNFLIALEQREAAAVSWLRAHRDEDHFVPNFVAVEYLTGHSAAEEALDALEASFTVVHGNGDWIRASVTLRRALRRRKARFRSPDFWIAAWAHYLGTTVVTRDAGHFGKLGVRVDTW